MKTIKPRGYWNYERCKEESLKYNTRNELKKNCNGAYRFIIKNKWQNSLFSHMKKPNYWTYKNCKKEILKYKTKGEFYKKSRNVYGAICKNKWYELFDHFPIINTPRGYWTKENCIIEALKYKTKDELRKNNSTVYSTIHNNKWYELFNHMEIIGNKYKRLVYVYEFKEDKHCYIGLTGNSKRRYSQHTNTEKTSPVFKHMSKTNNKPTYILKSNYVDVERAILLEEEILNKYIKNDWNILNKAKTGGIGGNNKKWTKEKCQSEALLYIKKSDYEKNSGSSYHAARKNNWLNEICSHMKTIKPDGFWKIKENCKKLSLNSKNRSDFKIKSNLAYESSRKNKWLDEFFPKKSFLQVLP